MNSDIFETFKDDLFKDDDLVSVIRAHLHIEHHVNEIIELMVPYPDDLKPIKLDYDGKINLLCALGVDPENTRVLKALGAMRNKFAHDLNYKLDKSNVKNLYETLNSNTKEILHNSHDSVRSKQEYKEIVTFKKLPFKEQFILVTVAIRRMVLKIKEEVENTV